MHKILVTGSNGLLGQKLVALLSADVEAECIATARGTNRLPDKRGYEYTTMDITDAAQVLEVVGRFKPDVIIHTAAMTQVDDCEEQRDLCDALNVDAVANMIAACEAHQVFLVHLGTDFIFDGTQGLLDEEAEANPISYYGESKLKSEQLLQASSIEWAVARTVLVYGVAHDMSRSNIILWVKNSLEQGKAIKVVDDQWRTPTLAEDLALGCTLIAKKRATGVFNISGKDYLNPWQMANMTAAYFGLETKTMQRADSSNFTQRAKRPPKTGFVIDKAREMLGYEPHSFLEGIAILAKQI